MFSNKSFDEFSKIVKESLQKRAASLIESEEFQSSILIKEFEDAEDQKKPALTRQELLKLLGTATYYNEIVNRVVSDEDFHSDIQDDEFARMYADEFGNEEHTEEDIVKVGSDEYEDHIFDGDVSESVKLQEENIHKVIAQVYHDEDQKWYRQTYITAAKSREHAVEKAKEVFGKRGQKYRNVEHDAEIDESVEHLEELSNETLASYKKKAREQSSAADKAGDTEKANKRFSGIMKATKKQFANDMKKEEVESKESDYVPSVYQKHNANGKYHVEFTARDDDGKTLFKKVYKVRANDNHHAQYKTKRIAKSEYPHIKSHMISTLKFFKESELEEKQLTPAELKKREEVAKAIEKKNPDMPMDKKMAVATSVAKKVAESEDKPMKHRVGVTVSDPHSDSVSKRKETVYKIVKLSAESKEHAVERAKQHYKKKGYKVHDAFHINHVNESEELSESKNISLSMVSKLMDDTKTKNQAVEKVAARFKISKQEAEKYVDQVIDSEMNEQAQLDELSKSTLGSYIKKASKERGWAGMEAPENTAHGRAAKETMKKRQRGLEKAVDRLTKEDVEQLDELSKTTLSSYTKKASLDAMSQGVHAGAMAQRGEKGDSEKFNKSFNKGSKRLRGIDKATDRLAKEDCMSTATRKTFKQFKEEAKKDPCWDGYEQVGMKEKDGKKVPNCVPKESK